MTSNGWIKIHKQFTQWEWYDCLPVKTAFIHCLLKANWKEKSYRGTTVKRGQFLTGISEFAQQTSLSYQQVRTAWNKLESTGEITTERTNKGTRITVCNYSTYQKRPEDYNNQDNKPDNNQITINQQSNNNQITTTKNTKNYKNNKNKKNTSSSGELPSKATDPELWDQAHELSELLRDRIIEDDPTHRLATNPPTIRNWQRQLELALRRDGRTYEQLEFMIDYLFTQDTEIANFWKPHIQSARKLRDKFDTIKNQIRKHHGKSKKATTDNINRNTFEAISDIDFEDAER